MGEFSGHGAEPHEESAPRGMGRSPMKWGIAPCEKTNISQLKRSILTAALRA